MSPADLRLRNMLFHGEPSPLSSNSENGPSTYPLKKTRLYMSILTTGLSVILAAIILMPRENSILWLSTYFVSMLIMAVATFKLRIRLLQIEKPEMPEDALAEAKKSARAIWRRMLLLLLISLTVLLLPLFMAGLLPLFLGELGRYIWFILMVSAASGFSIAEILFYLYIR